MTSPRVQERIQDLFITTMGRNILISDSGWCDQTIIDIASLLLTQTHTGTYFEI